MNKRITVILNLLVWASLISNVSKGQNLIFESNETINHIDASQEGIIYVAEKNQFCIANNFDKQKTCINTPKKITKIVSQNENACVIISDQVLFEYRNGIVEIIDSLPELILDAQRIGDYIFAATSSGIYKVNTSSSESTLISHKNQFVNAVLKLSSDSLLVSTDDGIEIINNGGTVIDRYSLQRSVIQTEILNDSTLAILTDNKEIYLLPKYGGTFQSIFKNEIEIKKIIVSQGDLFLLDESGIYQVTKGNTIPLSQGQYSDCIIGSNTIIATKDKQVVSINLTGRTIVTKEQNFSFFAEENGSYWIGQNKEILNLTEKESVLNIDSKKENLYISSIVVEDDKIFVGTMGEGLIVLNKKGEILKRFQSDEENNRNNIIQLKSLNDTLWVAYLNGIYTITIPTLEIANWQKQTMEKSYVYCIHPLSEDNFFVGTSDSGLLMYDHGNVKQFLDNKSIYTLHVDHDTIYVASEKHGVFRLIGDKYENIYNNGTIYSIATISNQLLLNQKNQSIVLDKKTLNALPLKVSPLKNCQLNGIQENENSVMVLFENGIYTINKKRLQNLSKTKLQLETPKQYNKDIPNGKTTFEYDANSFSFIYHPEIYFHNQSTNYKYRLLGLDSTWKSTQQNKLQYYNLSPGAYTFEVAHGFVKDFKPHKPKYYSFEIKKPFWTTNWFRLLALALSLFSIYKFIKRREKNIKQSQEIKNDKLRFQISRLKNQIDPHFLFNSYNSLMGLIEENPDSAIKATESLTNFYRQIIKVQDENVIPLSKEIEIAKDYFAIHKLRFENLISFSIEEPLDKSGKIMPLSLQFLIENAIKHNVINGKNKLFINVKRKDNRLIVSNNKTQIKNLKESSGYGLKNLKERSKIFSGKSITINDTPNTFSVSIPLVYD